jgi:hypothetical protein
MDLQQAVDNFERATQHCDNLVVVHRGHGGAAQGRRDKEVSINRAVIVLAVASWQALVQDYATACIDLSAPAPGSPLSQQSYAVLAGRVRNEIGRFATPNAENTRQLLMGAGFDPRPHWKWQQRAGQGRGMEQWVPADADKRINDWLHVRHAIAHGHAQLPQVDALQAVRLATQPPVHLQLRLIDAEQCLAFFRRIAKLTGVALASHLNAAAPT